MDTPQESQENPAESGIQPCVWTVQAWAADPRKLYGIILACVIAALTGWLLFRQAGFAIIGFLCIACATAEFWLPQRFRLDRNGASARCGISVTSIQWTDVKRVVPDELGVKLSPLASASRMSPFRGVYLRFGGNRDEVLARIRQVWGNDV